MRVSQVASEALIISMFKGQCRCVLPARRHVDGLCEAFIHVLVGFMETRSGVHTVGKP